MSQARALLAFRTVWQASRTRRLLLRLAPPMVFMLILLVLVMRRLRCLGLLGGGGCDNRHDSTQ